MTTATAVSPPRIAEVRGRALGVTLLAFFALAWVGWGYGWTSRDHPPGDSGHSRRVALRRL